MPSKQKIILALPKADPPAANMEVIDTIIRIDSLLPSGKMSLYEWGMYYRAQGTALEHALFRVLPGGLYDALLSQMLDRRASLLKVPFKEAGNV